MSSSAESRFDFDAMLMYGFVADADLNVLEVNQSLQLWMEELCSEPEVRKLYERIRKHEKIGLKEFIDGVLDPQSDAGLGELLDRHLIELEELVEAVNCGKPIRKEVYRTEDGYSIRRFFREPTSERLLLAVRIVKPSGSQMRGGRLKDRVDFVGVCSVRRENGDQPWQVRGFQGQLQEAWLRIEPVIKAGTQAGATALMGRNLSHNLGSHALYWLSQDETDEERRRFFRYVQMRLELMAGFATCMPLSTSTFDLGALVNGFSSNSILLKRICRSEGITEVSLEMPDDEVSISIPGGEIGIQAFYSLIENCIRDSAKYSVTCHPERKHLGVNLRIRDCNKLIEVTLCDDLQNYEFAVPRIESILNDLRVADETGRLISGGWGIKERLICASFLRGIRLEHLELPRQGKVSDLSLTSFKPGGFPLLGIKNVGGNLAWVFYLLKPEQEILLIMGNDKISTNYRALGSKDIAIKNFKWFQENIEKPHAIRHRFIVFNSLSLSEIEWVETSRDRLPETIFSFGSDRSSLEIMPPWLVDLTRSELRLEDLSVSILQRAWAEHLVRKRRPSLPVIVVADLYDQPLHFDTPRIHLLGAGDFRAWVSSTEIEAANLAVFWRHYEKPPRPDALLHYECYRMPDSLWQLLGAEIITGRDRDPKHIGPLAYRLIEAAITRILIVDERLDATTSQQETELAGIKQKDLLHWKGIDVRGSEYAGHADPSINLLIDWLGARPYDFLLLHQGIADKIRLTDNMPTEEICSLLQSKVRQLVFHSGRMDMAQLPNGVKFLPFSNLRAWIDEDVPKLYIVERLAQLRRI